MRTAAGATIGEDVRITCGSALASGSGAGEANAHASTANNAIIYE